MGEMERVISSASTGATLLLMLVWFFVGFWEGDKSYIRDAIIMFGVVALEVKARRRERDG